MTERHLLLLKQDVKVGKVKLPLWLLKQHDMEDNGEVKCVVKNGRTYSDLLECFFLWCIWFPLLYIPVHANCTYDIYPVHTYVISRNTKV